MKEIYANQPVFCMVSATIENPRDSVCAISAQTYNTV